MAALITSKLVLRGVVMRKFMLQTLSVSALNLVVLIGTGTAAIAADQWHHSVIDSTGTVYWVSMEMDIWDLPHMAYAKDGQIWYASRNAGEWNWITEQVAPAGYRPSITLNPSYAPVIVFSVEQGGDVGVADRSSSGWSVEYLDLQARQPAGQYDPNDGLHLYYIKEDDQSRIQHHRRWYGNWYNLPSYYVSSAPQISKFDSDYHPEWGSCIGYSYKRISGGDSWSYVNLNETSYYGGFWTDYSITGRPAFNILGNRAAICYQDGDNLYYIEDSGYGPPLYGPYEIALSATSPSLDEDTQERMHIACRLFPDFTVGYFVKDGNTWESEDLPHSVQQNGLDLETDLYGSAHIAMVSMASFLEYTWFGDPTGITGNEPPVGNGIIQRTTPMPAGEAITVILKEGITGPVVLSVLDLSGRTVRQRISEDPETVLDLSGLSSGVYVISAAQGSCNDSVLFTVLK